MVDALSWLERRTRKRATRIALTVLFLLPLLSGLVGRLTRNRGLNDDFEAVVCAGRQALAGAPYYGEVGACPDISHTPFVYLPWVADAMAAAIGAIGQTGVTVAYLVLYVAALGFMAHRVLIDRAAPGPFMARAAFLALITGSAVALGNVVILLHALVLAGALLLPRTVLPVALALGVAGAIKPVLAPLAAVLLLARLSWTQRLLGGALALVIAAAPTAASLAQGGETIAAWREITERQVFVAGPGEGFWGWLSVLGVSGMTPLGLASWAVFALVLAGLGWRVAAAGGLDDRARVWLGLAVGTLLIPRLMPIDVFLLAPGMVACALAARTAAPGVFPAASWLVVGGCFAAAIMGVVDLGDYALKAALLSFTACVALVGAALLRKREIAG